MKSFKTWLAEDLRSDLLDAAVKFHIVYGTKHPNDSAVAYNLKSGRNRAAKMGINFDQRVAEVEKIWKPGGCPQCHGLGDLLSMDRCPLCGGTGLQGMSPVQSKWWLDSYKKAEGFKSLRTMQQIHALSANPVVTGVIKAAHKVGIPYPDRLLDWEQGGDVESQIMNSEFYQGHEYDFYISGVHSLLHQIAQIVFKKAGYRGSWS